MTLETVTNLDTNMQATVTRVSRGYAVTLKDLDSGHKLPLVNIFESYVAAINNVNFVLGLVKTHDVTWVAV